uniref:Ribosomal protein S11 n=1 Tax=Monsonia speciosa TaxID=163694 RepID=B7T3U6_9ROSI|nr:ribosomal protein S11 [Monsonia speciosa]ACH47334.1 ribosomal protein S11 [Monsonia speciosa]ADJ66442.1 ribosomal protein S11 [Monsonia speciosa]
MAKPRRKVRIVTSFRPLRKRYFRLRKKVRRLRKGIIHIQVTRNNTIVTITDRRGRVAIWASAGACGFKGRRKGTPFAAQTTMEYAIQPLVKRGMRAANVLVNGSGRGKDAAVRTIFRNGIIPYFVQDMTPLPHNGCRPPKAKRKKRKLK